MKWTVFIVFLTLLTIVSCKSAKDKFEDKNYTGAFDEALSNLKKNKNTRENLSILKKSLRQLALQYNQQYSRLANLSDVEQKVPLADANIALLTRLEKAESYVVADSFYNYPKLKKENQQLRLEVGNHYKQSAISLLDEASSTGKKAPAQKAHEILVKAEKYHPDPQSLRSLKEEAVKRGTVITNIKVEHWTTDFSSFDVDRLFQRLGSTSDLFHKIYYDKNFKRSELDCEVELEIESVDFRNNTEVRTQSFTKKIVDRYEVIVDANGNKKEVPVYKDLTGAVEVTTHILRASTDINLRVNSITTDCPFRNDSWSREVTTRGESYRLSGDQRAIPDAYKTSGTQMKSRDELREDLLEELYNAVRYEFD